MMMRMTSRMTRVVGRRGLAGGPVLGIETSCDDTGVAVVDAGGRIRSEVLQSQWDLVAQFGGVFPDEARKAHARVVDGLVEQALAKAGVRPEQLGAVAVTLGPGLGPCLAVGAQKAAQFAREHGLPLVGVNHLVAHAAMPMMDPEMGEEIRSRPFVAVILSGGHTLIAKCRGVNAAHYQVLSDCLDDSIGEAFDKVWRLLSKHLEPMMSPEQMNIWRNGHPGAALEQLAALAPQVVRTLFSVPMSKRPNNPNFSFSGLKSQVARFLEKAPPRSVAEVATVAAAFQYTAFEHVIRQLRRALERMPSDKPALVVVSGGVASSKTLREALAEVEGAELVCPTKEYCVDNGVMVAWTGLLMLRQNLGVMQPSELDSLWFDSSWGLGPEKGVQKKQLKRD